LSSCQALTGRRATVKTSADGLLAGYQGVFLLRRALACLVSVPPTHLAGATQALGHCDPHNAFNVSVLRRAFGADVERVIGPAWLGYADTLNFRAVEGHRVRQLDNSDDGALRALMAACNAEEWEHSGIEIDHRPLFGLFVADTLVAAGTCRPRGGSLLDVGIVTHPAYRGWGYGRVVVGTMTAYGLARGHVMQYRTLQANTASMGIAHSLGYEGYATTLAVRLTA